ncbi:AAA family ATPase [Palleronia abyssalis]|uniref:Bacterial transcriptional activator domain-containing protein n=1 Tax=Palleronia abyssalis TaxID=1501240 RepID=A0A2R8BWL9_9RHOB|nr:AAA family ATPase [Palleronia abyssalis]SPJ24558.1 hypothetical protein PAA8504_02391 [Palleronia abyssalis]
MTEVPQATSFRLLGPFEIAAHGGRLTRFPTRRAQALLCVLLLEHGRSVSRERLCDMFWPNADAEGARASLRQELAVVRRALRQIGVEPPESVQDGVRFTLCGCVCDILELQALDSAPSLDLLSALCRGPLCEGMVGPTEAFEDYVSSHRLRLSERALALGLNLMERMALGKAEGDFVSTAKWVLELDPAQEVAHRALMSHYAKIGQAVLALRQYDLCREIMKTEFDIDPERETEALAARIRAGTQGGEASAAVDTVTSRRPLAILAIAATPSRSAGNPEGPDALRILSDALTELADEVCVPLGGELAGAFGAQVFVAFGVNGAQEHDLESAVRAGLRLVHQGIAPDGPIIRCALDYGPCVLGRGSDMGTRFDGLPLLWTQSRLGTIPPGEFWISDAIRAALPWIVAVQVDKAAAAWRIDRLDGRDTRFDHQKRSQRLTRFVGREAETDRIEAGWREVEAGSAVRLHIEGEPGIGKSRLCHQFATSLELRGGRILRFQGSPFLTGVVLGPFTALWDEASSPPGSRADARLNRAKADIAAAIRRASADQPMAVLIEDIQWCDPTTLDFIEDLGSLLDGSPILLLTTGRGFGRDRPTNEVLRLQRLDPVNAWDMAATILPDRVGRRIMEDIVRRSAGIPLCIEEFCRVAAEHPLVPSLTDIPASIEAAFFAQIDRLTEPERALLEAASLLGHRFEYGLLSATYDLELARMRPLLDALRREGLLYVTGRLPHAILEFRTAVVQEVVRRHLSQDRSRAFSARAARYLEVRYQSGEHAAAAMAAAHWAEADAPLKTVEWSLKAARGAIELSAPQEAVAHLERARAQIVHLAPRQQTVYEIETLSLLGPQLLAAKGFADPEVHEVNDRLRALAVEKKSPLAPQAHWGLWSYLVVRAELDQAAEVATALRRSEIDAPRAPRWLGPGLHYMDGLNAFYRGEFRRALIELEAGDKTVPDDHDVSNVDILGIDLSVAAGAYRAWCHAFLKDASSASEEAEAAALRAEDGGHGFSSAFARVMAAVSYLFLDRPDLAAPHAKIAASLAEEYCFAQISSQATICLGHIEGLSGDRGGLLRLERGLNMYLATGARLAVPYARYWLCQGYARAGRRAKADEQIRLIKAHVSRTGERYFDKHMQRGEQI